MKSVLFILISSSVYVHCDKRFSVEKNKGSALLSRRFGYCYSGVLLLETANSVITCLVTVPDCGLPNGTKLSYFINFC